MKLYVWYYLQSFVNNYHGGIAYSVAVSKERAIELIVDDAKRRSNQDKNIGLKEELERIEPDVYGIDTEFADWQFGED